MNILVIDIGGTNVKFLASGHKAPRKFPSGRELTPEGGPWRREIWGAYQTYTWNLE